MNVILHRARIVFKCSMVLIFLLVSSLQADLNPTNFAVQITAQVSTDPPRIVLDWPTDPDAKSYSVSKKLLSQRDWIPIKLLGPDASSFADDQVHVGTAMEYRIIKSTDQGYSGYGY